MPAFPTCTSRLLSLRDLHGAPLADYDWFPALDLLEVHWHGHLTADSLVRGIEGCLDLEHFADRPLPRRILTNHQQASGSWEEALPWLQYDWLPRVADRGSRLLAYVVSPDVASRLNQPKHAEFLQTLQQTFQIKSFRYLPTAWHWITHR